MLAIQLSRIRHVLLGLVDGIGDAIEQMNVDMEMEMGSGDE